MANTPRTTTAGRVSPGAPATRTPIRTAPTNATLASTLGELTDPIQGYEDHHIRLRKDLTVAEWRAGTSDVADRLYLPDVNDKALAGLKFNTALPKRLAVLTLAARLADLPNALTVLREPARFSAA